MKLRLEPQPPPHTAHTPLTSRRITPQRRSKNQQSIRGTRLTYQTTRHTAHAQKYPHNMGHALNRLGVDALGIWRGAGLASSSSRCSRCSRCSPYRDKCRSRSKVQVGGAAPRRPQTVASSSCGHALQPTSSNSGRVSERGRPPAAEGSLPSRAAPRTPPSSAGCRPGRGESASSACLASPIRGADLDRGADLEPASVSLPPGSRSTRCRSSRGGSSLCVWGGREREEA